VPAGARTVAASITQKRNISVLIFNPVQVASDTSALLSDNLSPRKQDIRHPSSRIKNRRLSLTRIRGTALRLFTASSPDTATSKMQSNIVNDSYPNITYPKLTRRSSSNELSERTCTAVQINGAVERVKGIEPS
jgi:hypothetical protein